MYNMLRMVVDTNNRSQPWRLKGPKELLERKLRPLQPNHKLEVVGRALSAALSHGSLTHAKASCSHFGALGAKSFALGSCGHINYVGSSELGGFACAEGLAVRITPLSPHLLLACSAGFRPCKGV